LPAITTWIHGQDTRREARFAIPGEYAAAAGASTLQKLTFCVADCCHGLPGNARGGRDTLDHRCEKIKVRILAERNPVGLRWL
jgi:hypothetical protein